MSKSKNTNLIFLDLETTGLSPTTDQILEIAILPVDADLQPLDAGFSALIYSSIAWDQLPERVQEMHAASGLWEALMEHHNELPGCGEIQRQAIQYCEKFAERGELPMAGSTIEFDRAFLKTYMPGLEKWFHYRNANASSMKEFFKRWFPDMPERPKTKNHRALQDCYDSVSEALWYKDRLEEVYIANDQMGQM